MRAELDSLGAVWVCSSAAATAAAEVAGIAAPPLEHLRPRTRIPGTQWLYLQSHCTCQMKSVHAPCGGRPLSPGGRCLPLGGSGMTADNVEETQKGSDEACPSWKQCRQQSGWHTTPVGGATGCAGCRGRWASCRRHSQQRCNLLQDALQPGAGCEQACLVLRRACTQACSAPSSFVLNMFGRRISHLLLFGVLNALVGGHAHVQGIRAALALLVGGLRRHGREGTLPTSRA